MLLYCLKQSCSPLCPLSNSRSKCDQEEPHCGQCTKRQLQCPGYRNLVDLMFRDESEHVIEKATTYRKRSGPRQPSPNPNSPSSSDESSSPAVSTPLDWKEAHAQSQFPPTRARRRKACALGTQSWLGQKQQELIKSKKSSILFDPELFLPCDSVDSFHERGMAFFFSRHVAKLDAGYQSYDFIYEVWKPPTNPNPHNQDSIAAAVVAIGLAGLSKVTRSIEMMNMARRSYGAALKLTTTALSDPVEAVKDSTLLSVLLLGTYEVVSGSTPQTMEAWQKHVDGAAALASLRGTDQFKTTAGCKMFQMLCYSVLLSCMRSDIPAPTVIEELRNKSLEMGKLDNTNKALIDHMFKTTHVRHQIKTGILTDRNEIVSTLENCDAEWARMASLLPDMWRYRNITLRAADPAAMHRNCHVYPGMIAAITWNGIRSTRMLLQEAIIQQLCRDVSDESYLSSSDQQLLVKAIKSHNTLSDAIIASVPQFFGVVKWEDFVGSSGEDLSPASATSDPSIPDVPPPSSNSSEPIVTPHEEVAGRKEQSAVAVLPSLFEKRDRPIGELWHNAERIMTLAATCTSILWPLYNIGISPNCCPPKRQYVYHRLVAIYEETGLENALEIAEIVRQKMTEYRTQKCKSTISAAMTEVQSVSLDI